MKYISIIESYYTGLSKSEKKVADYIKVQKGKVIYKTLTDISRDINVGEATILRFVKKIGFGGFQELKLEIAKEDTAEEEKYEDNYIDRITKNVKNIIDVNREIIDGEQVKKAIELINNAENIFIFGNGSSGIAASEMSNRFMRVGKITSAVTDSHFQIMYATTVKKDDLVIAISLSGQTLDLLDAVMVAREKGAKVIAITNYTLSEIAHNSDCVLLTAGKENPLDGGSLTSKISQLYIIDILTTGYAIGHKDRVVGLKKSVAKHLVKKTVN